MRVMSVRSVHAGEQDRWCRERDDHRDDGRTADDTPVRIEQREDNADEKTTEAQRRAEPPAWCPSKRFHLQLSAMGALGLDPAAMFRRSSGRVSGNCSRRRSRVVLSEGRDAETTTGAASSREDPFAIPAFMGLIDRRIASLRCWGRRRQASYSGEGRDGFTTTVETGVGPDSGFRLGVAGWVSATPAFTVSFDIRHAQS